MTLQLCRDYNYLTVLKHIHYRSNNHIAFKFSVMNKSCCIYQSMKFSNFTPILYDLIASVTIFDLDQHSYIERFLKKKYQVRLCFYL